MISTLLFNAILTKSGRRCTAGSLSLSIEMATASSITASNATAFQSRLKAAMTASGIDTALMFRHLFILRRGETPSGPKTAQLIDQFRQAGGKFIAPAAGDLRAFVALQAMSKRDMAGLAAWLRQRK